MAKAPQQRLEFTAFSSPDRLSKRFVRQADGSVVKQSGVAFYRGTAEHVTLTGKSPADVLRQLAARLDGLTSHEAIALGVARNRRTHNDISSLSLMTEEMHAITRTKSAFEHPAQGMVLLDMDGGARARDALAQLEPGLAKLATLTRPSSSARALVDGQPYGQGEHCFLLVSRTDKHKEVLHALRRLSWKAGLGRLRVSKAGTRLIDGAFDTTVWGAERLIFAAPPEVKPPIELAPPASRVTPGVVLDVDAFLERAIQLCPEEDYAALVERDSFEPAFMDRMTAAAAEHRERQRAKFEARGLSPRRAEFHARVQADRVRRAIKHPDEMPVYLLTPYDTVIDTKDREIAVADILAKPGDYAELRIADPIEGPEYGRGTAVIFVKPSGEPWVFSHAHGGCHYQLVELEQYEGDESYDDSVPYRYHHFRAHLPDHSYILIANGDRWILAGVNAYLPPVEVEGRDKPIAASSWLDKHRAVVGRTWWPGRPRIIEGYSVHEGELQPTPGVALYNEFTPAKPAIGDPSKAGPWREHGERLYGDMFKHAELWFACRVQWPDVKINHALVLGGRQGIGKDTLLAPVIEAIGQHNCQEISPQTLSLPFNGYMRSVLLRISEAYDLGNMNLWQLHERAKAIIAAPPDMVRINRKFIGEYHIPNLTGVVYTTNNPRTGLYIPPDDRRHYVMTTLLSREELEPDYFERLWGWLNKDGMGHVAAHLASLDVSKFDPGAPPPETQGWRELVDNNQPSENVELADALDSLRIAHANAGRGELQALTVGMLHDCGTYQLQDYLREAKHQRHIMDKLEGLGFTPLRNPDRKDGFWQVKARSFGIARVLPKLVDAEPPKLVRVRVYADKRLAVRDRLAAGLRLVEQLNQTARTGQ